MRSIFLMIMMTLMTGHLTSNKAFSHEEVDKAEPEDKMCYRSEEIGHGLGLYTLQILPGPEVQAIVIAWQDMITNIHFTAEDMRKHEQLVYTFKDYYEVRIIMKPAKPGGLDGAEAYTYKIDTKDFSIISRTLSNW